MDGGMEEMKDWKNEMKEGRKEGRKEMVEWKK